MQQLINPISLSFIAGIMVFTIFLLFLFIQRSSKTYPGFELWTTATFFLGLGGVLMGLRNIIPGIFSIVFGNGLIAISLALLKSGLFKFYGKKNNNLYDILALILFIVVQSYLTIFDDLFFRNVNVALFVIILLLPILKLLQQQNEEKTTHVSKALIWGIFLFVATNIIKTVFSAFCFYHQFKEIGLTIFGYSMFFQIPIILSIYMSLILTNAQHVTEDLSETQKQLNILQSLVPVCCNCKMIKNDQNDTWEPLENFIRTHSSSDVTHGICPEYLKKLYPEYIPQVNTAFSQNKGNISRFTLMKKY